MSDEDLRAKAEGATPGPWEVQTIHAEAWVCEVGRGGFGAVSLPATGRPDYGLANAAYIAAASPDRILALLDRLARVEALRDEWSEKRDGVLSPGLRLAVDDLDREWFALSVARNGAALSEPTTRTTDPEESTR